MPVGPVMYKINEGLYVSAVAHTLHIGFCAGVGFGAGSRVSR